VHRGEKLAVASTNIISEPEYVDYFHCIVSKLQGCRHNL